MHLEILSDRQLGLLPFVAKFKRRFYLVGGTWTTQMHGFEVDEQEVKEFLIDKSLQDI